MEKASNAELVRVTMLLGSDPVLRVLASKSMSVIDRGFDVGDDSTSLGYDFETEVATGIVATRATKYSKAGGSTVLDIPGLKVIWLKLAFYASIKSCELE